MTSGTPLRIFSSYANSLAAFAFATCVWLLFRTLRIRVLSGTPNTSPFDRDVDDRYLYSVWHDSMVLPVFGGRHWCTTALTSQHRDGSFVASVLRLRSIPSVRGSTNRIGTGAIRKLLETVTNRHLVITPDGPRGPNRVMSAGVAYLASRTGRAVVPSGFACSRCWRWKGSWSELIIPKPFSTVVLLAGAPIYVPGNTTRVGLQSYVDEIQAAMDHLDQEAKAQIERKNSKFRSPVSTLNRPERLRAA